MPFLEAAEHDLNPISAPVAPLVVAEDLSAETSGRGCRSVSLCLSMLPGTSQRHSPGLLSFIRRRADFPTRWRHRRSR